MTTLTEVILAWRLGETKGSSTEYAGSSENSGRLSEDELAVVWETPGELEARNKDQDHHVYANPNRVTARQCKESGMPKQKKQRTS